jgi:hypothetical protein
MRNGKAGLDSCGSTLDRVIIGCGYLAMDFRNEDCFQGFIDGYDKGLNLQQAGWAGQKYGGFSVVWETMMDLVENGQ